MIAFCVGFLVGYFACIVVTLRIERGIQRRMRGWD